MDGLLILDKPGGMTSQQALNRVRRALKVSKLGHTGTLDPLATGVLPIALGEATKIIPYLEEGTKSYRVIGRLGETTDSYDADGAVLRRADPSWVEASRLEAAVHGFLGSQEQMPPLYSAIKFRGRPLYDYARSGEGVERKSRRVHFESLELESFSRPDFTLQVNCSKGTYIRSLVHDIGERLGCGAHVIALRRLASGPFTLDRARTLDRVLEDPSGTLAELWSIEELLASWPKVELIDEEERRRVQAGVSLRRVNQIIEIKGLYDRQLALVRDRRIQALIVAAPGRDFEYLRVLQRQESV
ncbi:MAG TPA: tRNA pseudouridine(55) synthase TruB [bacterium]|nr:tRNA pseudouridine(55) synthase TruB [bacterium]